MFWSLMCTICSPGFLLPGKKAAEVQWLRTGFFSPKFQLSGLGIVPKLTNKDCWGTEASLGEPSLCHLLTSPENPTEQIMQEWNMWNPTFKRDNHIQAACWTSSPAMKKIKSCNQSSLMKITCCSFSSPNSAVLKSQTCFEASAELFFWCCLTA